MILLIRKIAAVAAGTLIVTWAFAQTAIESPASTSLTALQSVTPRQRIAERFEDAQQHARDLLTGDLRHERAPADKTQSLRGEHEASSIDPQEQARSLLLGTPNGGMVARVKPRRDKSASENSPPNPDAQTLAQRMILRAETATISAQMRSASTTMSADSQR